MINNNETRHISELLKELIEERNVTIEKLSLVTSIPHRFIVALLEADFKKLPAKPYVRGYLLRISSALNVDPIFILKSYKDTMEIRSSGGKDRLPVNRFAIQKINKNFIIVFFILIVIVGFLAFRMKDILGTPTIEVSLPINTFITQERSIKVSGRIDSKDSLTLNQEIVYTDDAGRFEKEINLSPGLNTFEFGAKRFLGQETKIIRQVFYEESVSKEPSIN